MLLPAIVLVTESKSGKHKCRRITKWKDSQEEGTIAFITNDLNTPANVLCEVYRRRWQIETLFKRLKQNFPLKYFLGDNQNAIQIQIWVCVIAWLLMQVIKRQVKRKWSLSNMMTAIHILMNSYIGLYDFLNLPEGLWMKAIKKREESQKTAPLKLPFSDMRGPFSRIQRPKLIYSILQRPNHDRSFLSDSNNFLYGYCCFRGLVSCVCS